VGKGWIDGAGWTGSVVSFEIFFPQNCVHALRFPPDLIDPDGWVIVAHICLGALDGMGGRGRVLMCAKSSLLAEREDAGEAQSMKLISELQMAWGDRWVDGRTCVTKCCILLRVR
jgi:hypothetical protein